MTDNSTTVKEDKIAEETGHELIKALPPLKVESAEGGGYEISKDGEPLLSISGEGGEYKLFVKGLDSIVSPIINNVEVGFHYENIPLSEEDIIEEPNVVISAGGLYLNLYLDYKSGYTLKEFNFSSSRFSLAADLNRLEVTLFNDLDDLYRHNSKRMDSRNGKVLPVRSFRPGLVTDYSSPLAPEYAKVRELLGQDDLFIMIKNWERRDRLLRANKNITGGLESLAFKLGLNELDFMLHYDNSLPMEEDGKDGPYLKKREGKPIVFDERGYIDYMSPEGGKRLGELYKYITVNKAAGIFLSPPFYRFANADDYRKSICKTGESYLPYHKGVGELLERLNGIIAEKQKDNFLFFSTILSPKLNNTVYIMESFSNFDRVSEQLERCFIQGYKNIGLSLKNRHKENYLSPNFIRTLTLLLALPVYLLDIEIVQNIIKLDTLKVLKRLLEYRLALRVHLFNMQKRGERTYKPAIVDNKQAGYHIGDGIFVSFLKEKIFEKFFYLPEGHWYCLSTGSFTEGGGFFAYRDDPTPFLIFFKKGSLIPYIEDRYYNRYLAPDKLKFYLFNGVNMDCEIEERKAARDKDEVVIHKVSSEEQNSCFVIKYSSSEKGAGRRICLELITGPCKIESCTINDKPLRVIKPEKTNSLEINFKSKNEEQVIELTLLPAKI